MNTENNNQNEVTAAVDNDPALQVASDQRPAPMSQKEVRKVLQAMENNVHQRLRNVGMFNTVAGRAFRSGLNAFVNRSSHAMAAALHFTIYGNAEERTGHLSVAFDRSATGESINPSDSGSMSFDPEGKLERVTRVFDQPFLIVGITQHPEGTEDLPAEDLIQDFGAVPNGIAQLEMQAQQILQQSPDRGLMTFFQAYVTFFIDALWRSEGLRKNLKKRNFLPHVRLYQMTSTDRHIRFTIDIGNRVQEDGMVEQFVGDGESAKVEMVPGKVWRFTGKCERILVSIDPLQMFESARVDQWYPDFYAAQDEMAKRAAQDMVAKANAEKGEPNPEDSEFVQRDTILLPLGRPTHTGRIYSPELMEAHLAEGGQLRGLIERGTVYGEYGAPRNTADLPASEWSKRAAEVVLDNVAVRIDNIRINDARDALVGDIVPFGPQSGLPAQLIRGGQQVEVAMRSFTVTDKDNPNVITEVRAVVAFDLVATQSTPEMLEEIRQSLPEGALIEEPKPVDYVITGVDPAAPGTQDSSPELAPAFDGQSK